jgi:hypothetical protein
MHAHAVDVCVEAALVAAIAVEALLVLQLW